MTGTLVPPRGPGSGLQGRAGDAEPEVWNPEGRNPEGWNPGDWEPGDGEPRDGEPGVSARTGEVPRIDPRFARRWTQVRREEGRRRLRIVVVAGTVLVAAALAAGSLYSPLLAARHVRITAPRSVSTKAVLSVAGLVHPRPLIEVDTAAVAARLDAVPQWGAARVRRSWPTTVFITVVFRTPVAVTGAGSAGWATVDATGRVLADFRTPASGLPVVRGVGPVPRPGGWLRDSAGPSAVPPAAPGGRPLADLSASADSPSVPLGVAAALAAVAALPASVRSDVQSVTVGADGRLSMSVLTPALVAGPVPVDLGDGSQLAAKLTALGAMLTQASLSGVTGINLSVPDRPAALTARQTPGTLSTHAGG